jgi:hypothetical protein
MEEDMSALATAESLSKIFAAIVIPVVIAIVGHEYSKAVKQREIEAKYVELAVGILRSPPVDEAFDIRSWAVEVVDRHSGIKLSPAQRDDFIRTGTLQEAVVAGPAGAGDAPVPVPGPSAPVTPTDQAVTVPNVRGLTIIAARDAFQRAGLQPTAEMVSMPDTALIDRQDPPAGSRVDRDTRVGVAVAQRYVIPETRLRSSLDLQTRRQ